MSDAKPGAVIAACLSLFLLGGVLLERSRAFLPLKKSLRAQLVPTAILDYGDTGRLLQHLDLVEPVRNDYDRYPAQPARANARNTEVGAFLYKVNPAGTRSTPAGADLKPGDFIDGWPALSITVDEEYLDDPATGIRTNYERRGREWERRAHVAYYERGEKVFASVAGLRLHGGKRRKGGRSFRLYFREEYGADQFRPGILFGDTTRPIRRLVVRMDNQETMPFIGSLAFDISQLIGCRVPGARPAILFLNGKRIPNIYILTEHLGKTQLTSRMGHENFLFWRPKGNTDARSRKHYEELKDWVKEADAESIVVDAEDHFDLDSLCRYVLSVAYCGTSDGFQGVAVRDMSEPGSRWFWINWDMDHSFRDKYKEGEPGRPWTQPGFDLIRRRRYVPPLLCRRLLASDVAFRDRFVHVATEALNHKLTLEALLERIAFYEGLASAYGVENLESFDRMRAYVRQRKAFLRTDMRKYLRAKEWFAVTVENPGGLPYRVDGHHKTGEYRGWYTSGAPITLEVTDTGRAAFLHWLVEGEKIRGDSLELAVKSKAQLKIVTRSSQP